MLFVNHYYAREMHKISWLLSAQCTSRDQIPKHNLLKFNEVFFKGAQRINSCEFYLLLWRCIFLSGRSTFFSLWEGPSSACLLQCMCYLVPLPSGRQQWLLWNWSPLGSSTDYHQQLTCVTPKTTLAKANSFLADSRVQENRGFLAL